MVVTYSYIYIYCPFCNAPNFDAIGLKNYLLNRWCDVFESTPTNYPRQEITTNAR